MRLLITFCLFILLTLVRLPTFAQDHSPQTKENEKQEQTEEKHKQKDTEQEVNTALSNVHTLEQITITGTRPNDFENRRLSHAVVQTGLSHKSFKNLINTHNFGDILQQLSGFTSGGAIGQNDDIHLRGIDKEYARLDLNGITLPCGGEKREFRPNRLSSLLIDEIAIIRNPTAEYDRDGIGG